MSVQEGSISAYLDIFDLSDRLSLRILEEYQDRVLRLGTLILKPKPQDMENYRVYLNGRLAGEGLRKIPYLEEGTYDLRIEEFYQDGRTRETVNRKIEIQAEEERQVAVKRFPYTEVTLQDRGAGLPYEVKAGNREASGTGDVTLLVPPGVHTILVAQSDYRGRPYPVLNVDLSVKLGRVYQLDLKTQELGRGFVFRPNGVESEENREEAEILLDGQRITKDRVDVLPLGDHSLEIYQEIEGKRLLIREEVCANHKEELREIRFPLFETRLEWLVYRRNSRPSLSAELQGLDSAYLQAGLRGEVFRRRLGLSLLGGG